MGKVILSFLFLSIAIGVSVHVFRGMNNLEKWHLTKLLFFSTMCSLAALVVMLLIVVLF
jgi:hypothetical protein